MSAILAHPHLAASNEDYLLPAVLTPAFSDSVLHIQDCWYIAVLRQH